MTQNDEGDMLAPMWLFDHVAACIRKGDATEQMAQNVEYLRAIMGTQAARIAELEGEREALSLAICGGEDAPGYAASLNVAVLEEVARSNRLSHIQALETVSRNLRHWREECGKLYSRIATLEAEKREAVMQQLASDGQACEAYAAQRVAEAEVARLREALTVIAGDPEAKVESYRRALDLSREVARAALNPKAEGV